MNYSGHLAGGITTSIITGATTFILSGLNILTGAVCGITTLIFSLYPDLDIASKPSRYAYIIGIPAIFYFAYVGLGLQAILTFALIGIPKAFPHRGLVHTLKFGLAAVVCWIYILEPYASSVSNIFLLVSGMVGYLTHLILDSHVRI